MYRYLDNKTSLFIRHTRFMKECKNIIFLLTQKMLNNYVQISAFIES